MHPPPPRSSEREHVTCTSLCRTAPQHDAVRVGPWFFHLSLVDGHYYTNFTGDGRFRFPAAGKAVRRGLEATVNRGLTAAGGFARRG